MEYTQAIFLSIIEGITEFLPVSSTGHLILASKLLHIPQTEFVKSFEITIQLGAILAVVFLYFKSVINSPETWKRVLVAFMPSGVIGLLAYKFIKTNFLGNLNMVIISLFVGGVAMFVLEELFKNQSRQAKLIKNLSLSESVTIGIAQTVSMIPGVSRAMATIFGGLGVGLSKKSATEFSFLLAIPTMLAATSFDLMKTRFLLDTKEYFILLIGFIGAFVSALVTVKGLLNFVQKHSFRVFAVYRIVLAFFFWLIYR